MILVTGASGFVGRSLISRLATDNLKVRACVRTGHFPLPEKIDVVYGHNLTANTDWHDVLEGVGVVIHLAARVHVMKDKVAEPLTEFRKVNVDGTLNLARQAATAGVKRFIFISSIKVNGEHTENGRPFTESDAPNPQDAYGISKFEAEQGLLKIAQQTGMEIVIIRPPLVYGPGVKANFASMMKAVRRKIPLPLGAIHNKRSFVYVENLVSLIVCCINHTNAANQTFLVSDDQDLSTTELLRSCALALNVNVWLFPLPQKMIEVLATTLGKRDVAQRLCGNLQVDIAKAKMLLGWVPPISVEDGLTATALDLVRGQ